MNSKAPYMSLSRPLRQVPVMRLFTAFVIALALALLVGPQRLLYPQPAEAKPHISIPGLQALKKKFTKKRRRKRSRRRKNQPVSNPAATAATAAAATAATAATGSAAIAPTPLPPLPVRNPRIRKTKSRIVRTSRKNLPVNWRRAKSAKNSRPQKNSRIKITRVKTRLIKIPRGKASRVKTELRGKSAPKNRAKNTRTSRLAALAALALPPLPTKKPRRHPSKVAEPDWSKRLISKAVEQCANLGIKVKPLPPVKKGRCGNPAPVLLAKVDIATIRPAATLSCPMAANLQSWFQQSVQPLAEKHFGKKVTQIRNISSYVCRNRYGDTTTRISEHAYANALDIAWFELQGGEKISVEKDWNNPEGEKSAFLHALHKSACKQFGTVLGPDANAAHKNHFHLDKAPRKRSNYCR